MALSKEDHGDVKKAFGKALADKVSKVTRDSKPKSGYEQHLHEQKEGKKIEKEERQASRFGGPVIKARRIK